MSATLNSIAIDVVGQYGEAAKHLVNAYRSGTERAVTGLGARYEKVLEQRVPAIVSDELKAGIIDREQRIVGFVVDAVGRVSDRASSAVELVSSRTIEGMEAFAEKTAWANDLIAVDALRAVNMPAAKLSLQIATRVNATSRLLSERIGGAAQAQPAKAAKAVRAAKTVSAGTAAKRRRRVARKG
jgi:hypothetical protein